MILSTYFIVRASYLSSVDKELVNIAKSMRNIPTSIFQDEVNVNESLNKANSHELITSEFYYAVISKGEIIEEDPPRFHVENNKIEVYAKPTIDITLTNPEINISTVNSVGSFDSREDMINKPKYLPFLTGSVAIYTIDTSWRIVSFSPMNSDDIIYIGTPLKTIENNLSTILIVLIISSAILILFSIFIIFQVVRRNLRPLKNIEQAADRIASINYSEKHIVEFIPITETKETEIGSLELSLNKMLNEINKALIAKDDEQRKTKRFVSDSSHELRTPIAIIKGYIDLYKMGAVGEGNLDDLLEKLSGSTSRLQSLVEDLLTLTRIDEGKELKSEKVDILPLLKTAKSDLEALNLERIVTITTNSTDEIGETLIMTDISKLEEVFQNLIGNINKYTKPDTPVEISLEKDDDKVTVKFIDHGCGVPNSELSNIFDRFTVLDDSRATATSGSGLGLSIVKSLIEAMGGQVWASQSEPTGLTVNITLNRAK
jgi:two-component system OmpR family sensor kinase